MLPRLKFMDGKWFCYYPEPHKLFHVGMGATPRAAYASWVRLVFIG